MRIFLIILFCFTNGVYAMELVQSKYDFQTTWDKVKSEITKRNIEIFAEFNHTKNAEQIGMSLKPTNVIVFGNPKVGTLLMQENQDIALELPLKIAVIEKNGKVFLEATDIQALAKKYNIKNAKIVANIQNLLSEILESSSGL